MAKVHNSRRRRRRSRRRRIRVASRLPDQQESLEQFLRLLCRGLFRACARSVLSDNRRLPAPMAGVPVRRRRYELDYDLPREAHYRLHEHARLLLCGRDRTLRADVEDDYRRKRRRSSLRNGRVPRDRDRDRRIDRLVVLRLLALSSSYLP